MTFFTYQLKKWITPYTTDSVLGNFFLFVPRVVTGALLAFVYAPNKFGTPWTPGTLELSLFEVSEEFVALIAYQGYPFDTMPYLFAWSIGFMEAFGGILLILGLNTRMTAFFVFLTMAMGIFFRKWDGTWDIVPVFSFFCLGLFFMGFGSGKWGLDYWFSQRGF
ncbi:DoxX family protein [Maribacter sp. R77961]|jgi:putative oxidoreductase|uniref:DoxX family protein n=1 Tax=Maribacter sp. R77961 TaxID=3093871 RepID=UPI0037C6B66D